MTETLNTTRDRWLDLAISFILSSGLALTSLRLVRDPTYLIFSQVHDIAVLPLKVLVSWPTYFLEGLASVLGSGSVIGSNFGIYLVLYFPIVLGISNLIGWFTLFYLGCRAMRHTVGSSTTVGGEVFATAVVAAVLFVPGANTPLKAAEMCLNGQSTFTSDCIGTVFYKLHQEGAGIKDMIQFCRRLPNDKPVVPFESEVLEPDVNQRPYCVYQIDGIFMHLDIDTGEQLKARFEKETNAESDPNRLVRVSTDSEAQADRERGRIQALICREFAAQSGSPELNDQCLRYQLAILDQSSPREAFRNAALKLCDYFTGAKPRHFCRSEIW